MCPNGPTCYYFERNRCNYGGVAAHSPPATAVAPAEAAAAAHAAMMMTALTAGITALTMGGAGFCSCGCGAAAGSCTTSAFYAGANKGFADGIAAAEAATRAAAAAAAAAAATGDSIREAQMGALLRFLELILSFGIPPATLKACTIVRGRGPFALRCLAALGYDMDRLPADKFAVPDHGVEATKWCMTIQRLLQCVRALNNPAQLIAALQHIAPIFITEVKLRVPEPNKQTAAVLVIARSAESLTAATVFEQWLTVGKPGKLPAPESLI